MTSMTPRHVHTTCQGEHPTAEELAEVEAMPEDYGAAEREAELDGQTQS